MRGVLRTSQLHFLSLEIHTQKVPQFQVEISRIYFNSWLRIFCVSIFTFHWKLVKLSTCREASNLRVEFGCETFNWPDWRNITSKRPTDNSDHYSNDNWCILIRYAFRSNWFELGAPRVEYSDSMAKRCSRSRIRKLKKTAHYSSRNGFPPTQNWRNRSTETGKRYAS